MDLSFMDTILGGGIAALFFTWGGIRARNKPAEYTVPKEPEPICGCSHHYAYHDTDGVCSEVNSQGRVRVVDGQETRILAPCRCKKYVGPEPMPRYIS